MFAMTYFRFEIPLDVDEATIECAFSLTVWFKISMNYKKQTSHPIFDILNEYRGLIMLSQWSRQLLIKTILSLTAMPNISLYVQLNWSKMFQVFKNGFLVMLGLVQCVKQCGQIRLGPAKQMPQFLIPKTFIWLWWAGKFNKKNFNHPFLWPSTLCVQEHEKSLK